MAKYHANGVLVSPEVPSTRSTAKITYNGLLSTSGATEVYAHIGYGQKWEDISDHKMKKTPHGFETSVSIPHHADSLNVCFKDSANNWDNNTGANYSFNVQTTDANYSVEFADEVSTLDNMFDRYRSAISRFFKD